MPGRLLSQRLENASAPLLIVMGGLSVQAGAAFATRLFDNAGPLGTVWLRVGFAALVLLALSRGSLRRPDRATLPWVAALGVALAVMNASFYEAIARVPLGVVVTVEFLGPLAVAVAGSRRAQEFLWIVLAGAGVALLGSPTVHIDRVGLGFALAAGTCWAGYIVFAKRVVGSGPLLSGLTLAMLLGAVLLAPFGLVSAGSALLEPWLLAAGFGVALLSSVVPYVLELAALRRVRVSTFGILMSIEPALAALVGAVVLGQSLRPLELLALAFVVVASAGANRRATAALPPEA